MIALEIFVPSVVILVGPSGSGKSTFARTFFRDTEILSSDRCRALVSDSENNQSATDDAFQLLATVAAMRLRRGRLSVVDATNLLPRDRGKYLALARDGGCPASAIVLQSTLADCITRTKARLDRDIPLAALEQQYEQFRVYAPLLEEEGFSPVWRISLSIDLPMSAQCAVTRVPARG